MGQQIKIVIFCYRKDYYFTRICVASIRYYYPNIQIYLVKDYKDGYFSSQDLEKYFGCTVLDLGVRIYGWGTAKIHFLLQTRLKKERYLILDTDTVFIGPVLSQVKKIPDADFIVSPERIGKRPEGPFFRRIYYPYSWVKRVFPDLHFPGYIFNSGQFIGTPGILVAKDIAPVFDPTIFPYWRKRSKGYLRSSDQGLLNIMLPLMAHRGDIQLKAVPFMWWSESKKVKSSIVLEKIKHGTYPYLIHWAGPYKNPNIWTMTRADILDFFQRAYYRRLPLGTLRYFVNRYYLTVKTVIYIMLQNAHRVL